MQDITTKHSQPWTLFTMVSFGLSAAMMAIGIFNLEASFAAKGFYAMAAFMLVHSSVTLTKTLRDREEAIKFHNRIEDARTEKLLMDVGSSNKA